MRKNISTIYELCNTSCSGLMGQMVQRDGQHHCIIQFARGWAMQYYIMLQARAFHGHPQYKMHAVWSKNHNCFQSQGSAF